MKPTLKLAAAALVLGLVGSAASAQACTCTRSHHVRTAHHVRPARHVTTVRYVRQVVREPVYVQSYEPGYDRSAYYAEPYRYTVVRPAYAYWRPRPVIVRYEEPYAWRHHHREYAWEGQWRRHDRGWHRGWEHRRHDRWRG